jgi:hypothetical protein
LLLLQVRSIVDTLVDVLKTPSSDVQRSVSDCLSPLMASLAADEVYTDKVLKRVLEVLVKGATYGDRWARSVLSLGVTCLDAMPRC